MVTAAENNAVTAALMVPWYPVVNDLIGGWSVATRNAPCSELNFKQGQDLEIACFIDETIARYIADLHNYALSGGGCEW